MATVNIMAEEMAVSELEEDQDLLIEALRKHLTYVESRLAEIARQMQGTSSPVVPEATGVHRGGKKESVRARPTAVEEPVPTRPKLPRASELTRLPHKAKPVLSDKEKEKLQKEAAARRRQNKEHLSMLKALEHLKCDYRDRYLELMQQQVREQQRRVREKDVEWAKKLAQQEERAKKQRLRRKPRVFRSSAIADYTFLDNVHQGIFYKIVSLEMELRKKGVLKSLQDLKTFWDHMLSRENGTESSAVATAAVHRASSQARIHQHHVAESPVLEEGEEDSSHSWAITAVPGTDRGASTRIQAGSVQSKPQITQSSQSLQLQPAEPPQFESLHQLLRSSSWEEKQETQRHTAKVRAMQKKTRMVEHMFDVARANEQVTARLLEHLDIDLTFEVLPPPLECLPLPSSASPSTLSMTALTPTSAHPADEEEEMEEVDQRKDGAGGGAPEESVTVTSGSSSMLDLTSPTNEETEQPASSTPPPPPPPCIPLTMESLMVGGDVKAAKSTSMWSNYLLAGR